MFKKTLLKIKKIHPKLVFESIFPILFLSSLLLLFLWLGINTFNLNADVSRDLSELSNLWIKKIVWLGPHLRVGFPASPIYFYLLLPGLFLSGGSAYSLIASQVIIAISSFTALIYFSKNKFQIGLYLSILFIGLSNWWITSTIKPWNGNMYVLWILLALIFLWNKKRLWISLLLFGTAVAIHPAALVITPIFLLETWTYKSLGIIRKIIYLLGGMLLPWAPIIYFEIITKGYLVRQWLIRSETGMSQVFNMSNINALISMTGVSKLLLFLLLSYSLIKGSARARKWYLLLIPALLFLASISALHQYYLYGTLIAFAFLITQTISKSKIGQILLLITIIVFSKNLMNKYSFDFNQPLDNRLERITKVFNTLENSNQLNQETTYALISVINDQNSTPQADDYRFIFRTNGYQATNIDQYPTTDYLFIFFENDQKKPQDWNDWHSDYFGNKELINSQVINNIGVLTYKRK